MVLLVDNHSLEQMNGLKKKSKKSDSSGEPTKEVKAEASLNWLEKWHAENVKE